MKRRRKRAPSPLDEDVLPVIDPDGDTTSEEDLCTRCGEPRFAHAEGDRCKFYELE